MGTGFEVLKFQAQGLGYSVLLLLPILAVLVAISSSELTNWTSEGAVPTYNANVFYTLMFSLMIGGLVVFETAHFMVCDPIVVPFHGWKVALSVVLPIASTSTIVIVLSCTALPISIGTDPHFSYLDVLGFVLAAGVGAISSEALARLASRKIQPQYHKDIFKATGHTANTDKGGAASLFGQIIFELFIVAVIVAYPIVIIPIYSGVLNDTGRLVYSLVVHPLILEMVLFKCRSRATEEYNDFLRNQGLPKDTINERLMMMQQATDAPFVVEAVLVFNRRFMLSLMSEPTVTTIAIVLTAVEEAIARATMIDRDRLFRRIAGKEELTGKELEKQKLIWTIQSGNSMVIEITAIMVHAVSVYLFVPHRFVFNFGYGSIESEGAALAVVVMSMLLELVGELITDHISILAEKAHGVPVGRYFDLLSTSAVGMFHLGTLLTITGVALWTFSRVPSAAFCDDTNPCSCLDLAVAPEESRTNFEIYREICSCQTAVSNLSNLTSANASVSECANTTSDASARFVSSTSDVDSELLTQLGFALSAVLATSMLVYASISVAKRRRAQAKVDAAEAMLGDKDKIISEKSLVIHKQSSKLARLESAKRDLELRFLPTTEEERLFLPFREKLRSIVGEAFLASAEFSFVRKLGTGAFGEVHLAEWRRRGFDESIEVAVKMLHGNKLDSQMQLDSLLDEIHNLSSLSHPRVVRFYGVVWPEKAFPGIASRSLLSIVMEFVMNGTLKDLLHGTAKADAIPVTWLDPLLKIASDAAEGMLYLHDRSYIHRDLKPENVLMTRTFGGKLADLGEARVMDLNVTMTMTGTPYYCAPEILLGESYTEVIDVYSYGVMLNEMDTQQVPYRDGDLERSKFNPIHVMESGMRPLIRTKCPELWALIEECWCQDPAERPKASEILGRLHAHGNSFDISRDQWLSFLTKKKKQRKKSNAQVPQVEQVGWFFPQSNHDVPLPAESKGTAAKRTTEEYSFKSDDPEHNKAKSSANEVHGFLLSDDNNPSTIGAVTEHVILDRSANETVLNHGNRSPGLTIAKAKHSDDLQEKIERLRQELAKTATLLGEKDVALKDLEAKKDSELRAKDAHIAELIGKLTNPR